MNIAELNDIMKKDLYTWITAASEEELLLEVLKDMRDNRQEIIIAVDIRRMITAGERFYIAFNDKRIAVMDEGLYSLVVKEEDEQIECSCCGDIFCIVGVG